MCGGQLNAIDDDTFLDLWHKRLAHISHNGLQLLAKQSLIPMARDKSSNPCDLLIWKATQSIIPKELHSKIREIEISIF